MSTIPAPFTEPQFLLGQSWKVTRLTQPLLNPLVTGAQCFPHPWIGNGSVKAHAQEYFTWTLLSRVRHPSLGLITSVLSIGLLTKVSVCFLRKIRRCRRGVLQYSRMRPGKLRLRTCHPRASKRIERLDPKEEGTVCTFVSFIPPKTALERGL